MTVNFREPVGDEAEEKRKILRFAQGHCMCSSFNHDHRKPCRRLLHSTFKFYNRFQDDRPISFSSHIAVCSICARYIKEVGY